MPCNVEKRLLLMRKKEQWRTGIIATPSKNLFIVACGMFTKQIKLDVAMMYSSFLVASFDLLEVQRRVRKKES